MATDRPRALVSGASIAGPVLAYWLERFGYAPTVVERTPEVRMGTGGHAVDLFGPAVELMDWMGLEGQVESARTVTRVFSFIRPGRPPVDVSAETASEGVSSRHVEIMRGDLARILHEAARQRVEYVFDDSVAALHDAGPRVEVTFERSAPREFDVVIGADGLHSTTRRLVFGPEPEFLRFLGGYLAVFTAPDHLRLGDRMVAFSAPGRTAAMYPVRDTGQARVVLLWRTPMPHDVARHDVAAQRGLIRSRYGDLGWELPRLLAALDQADDLYLDSISQVVMDSWVRGRVGLVGDAGYSPGPAVGGGTSLAVIGAYMLATELASAGNPVRALDRYQQAMRPVVAHSRNIGPTVMKFLVPRSAAQIWFTAQAMRVLPRVPEPLRRRLTSFGGSAAAMLREARLRRPEDVPLARPFPS